MDGDVAFGTQNRSNVYACQIPGPLADVQHIEWFACRLSWERLIETAHPALHIFTDNLPVDL
jgi:hypothetical protein